MAHHTAHLKPISDESAYAVEGDVTVAVGDTVALGEGGSEFTVETITRTFLGPLASGRVGGTIYMAFFIRED